MPEKTLDHKLAALRDDLNCGAFILADAKDADMAFGLAAPGRRQASDPPGPPLRSLAEYREHIRAIVAQGLVDIMLMSAHTNAVLTIDERLFDQSPVTPAARANDTTDIHLPRGGRYAAEPSRPFATASIDHIQAGRLDPEPTERRRGANLGLYSLTLNNRLEHDLRTLEAYRDFRQAAERCGFRHFAEVFDPNAPADLAETDYPAFINDQIARLLAGVPAAQRPAFLKIAYHGPAPLEELVAYDPTLIVGILGGSAGTTYDAFRLLEEARQYGARAALFGRKINASEHPLTFVRFLRAIADGELAAREAVQAYHAELERLGLAPQRALAADLEQTDPVLSYAR